MVVLSAFFLCVGCDCDAVFHFRYDGLYDDPCWMDSFVEHQIRAEFGMYGVVDVLFSSTHKERVRTMTCNSIRAQLYDTQRRWNHRRMGIENKMLYFIVDLHREC